MEWDWKLEEIDTARAKRASKVKLESIEVNGEQATADVVDEASGEIVYHTMLDDCDCQDFRFNTKGNKPCKHILALAMAVGIVNKNGYTPEQQRLVDIDALKERIAVAAGYYHVFHESVMNNSEYDAMKAELYKLQHM